MWPAHRFQSDHWGPAPSPPHTEPRTLRLVTLNTWFAEDDRAARLQGQLAALQTVRPDVIALQEVTSDLLEQLLESPWLRAEYAVPAIPHLPLATHGYGVFLAVRPTVEHFTWHPLDSVMGRGLLAAHLGDGTVVGTVHLESMAPYAQARRQQLAQCTEWLANARAAVLMGDFNFDDTEPDAPDLGPWADLWTALRPGDPGYTVDSELNPYRQRRGHTRRRIDRVVVRDPSHRWLATSIDRFGTAVLPDGHHMSDHFGLEVDLCRQS